MNESRFIGEYTITKKGAKTSEKSKLLKSPSLADQDIKKNKNGEWIQMDSAPEPKGGIQ